METSISFIGSFARQVLDRSKRALVSGIASRGIFLQPEDDLTLYLSLEEFPGPLTLNIRKQPGWLDKIKAGCPALFHSGEIIFPDKRITISLESSPIWHPPRVDKKLKFIPGHLDSVISLVNKLTPDNPYLPLLSNNPGQIPGPPVIGERILHFQQALGRGFPQEIMDGAIKLLGLGPGLTPVGDDFLLGVLLTFNRWGHIISPTLADTQEGDSPASSPAGRSRPSHYPINDLNQTIVEYTRLKTTRISSSLLTCALAGAADERLIQVLDGLISGVEITHNQMRNLLRWGNSSGITALAGMISALKAKDTVPPGETVS